MKTMISESINGVDKVQRYGWVMKNEPGVLKNLHKDMLQIHPSYQRDAVHSKIKEITANWSWISAGVIVVGERGGEFWVIDGQHRVLSAKRRSDITYLPCVIFKTEAIKQEAIAFLDLNTGRKPVSSIGKFKAMIAAGDEAACNVKRIFSDLGVEAKATANHPNEIKSVAWAVKRAGENLKRFETVMRTAVDIGKDITLQERLLDGLWYIDEHVSCGIDDKKLYDRLRTIGGKKLIEGANKASAYFVRGGAKVWATGMIEEINKGLRNKYVLRDSSLL